MSDVSVRIPVEKRRLRMGARAAGWTLLLVLFFGSIALSILFGGASSVTCPLGMDSVRPDRSVCELAFGGLWVSMSLGILAGALATGVGLAAAALARSGGVRADTWTMRVSDAFFALPDVLVVMVLQFAGQTLGDVKPEWRIPPFLLMVVCLALVGWAGPARMFRNRLVSLGQQEFVGASVALGATRWHLLRRHLWPGLRGFALTVFLTRLPAAILAESTVSFFGIARVEPMSLGRYLGTSVTTVLYEGGARIVLPAWILLVLVVLGATLARGGAARREPITK